MEQVIGTLQTWITLYGLKVIAAIAIFVVGQFVINMLRKVLKRVLRRGHIDETMISFISSVSHVAMMAFLIITVLDKLGVPTASFLAAIGAAGLAVGLALQGSLSNFAAGVLMVIFKPFTVGDYVEVAGTSGVIEEIGMLNTGLRSLDNRSIIIPNAKITSDNIINYSARDTRRVDIVASVSYGDDLDKVRSVLESILLADPRILRDPAPTIDVMELADYSVKFAVRPWVKTAEYWTVFCALQEQIKKRFDAEGITIPFPRQDIHLHQTGLAVPGLVFERPAIQEGSIPASSSNFFVPENGSSIPPKSGEGRA